MLADKSLVLSLLDLTSLNDSDTQNTIDILCQKAATAQGHVAAVCVYPRFVKQASFALQGSPVKIATVANFPYGTDSLEKTLHSIEESIGNGAQEIDVVIPYPSLLAGDLQSPQDFINACKAVCSSKIVLKVILETGILEKNSIITTACEIAIEQGADFLKTSTGKVAVGATLEAAEVVLLAIKRSKQPVGFKASGGIRTLDDAKKYIALANQIMGPGWVSQNSFRLGASSLIDVILAG